MDINWKKCLVRAGALSFGLGIGAGILGEQVTAGIILFVTASVCWLIASTMKETNEA